MAKFAEFTLHEANGRTIAINTDQIDHMRVDWDRSDLCVIKMINDKNHYVLGTYEETLATLRTAK